MSKCNNCGTTKKSVEYISVCRKGRSGYPYWVVWYKDGE